MLLDNPSSNRGKCYQDKIICQERIRQARHGFDAALILTVASSTVTLAGIILLLAGQVSQGSLTTVGGLASNLVSVRCLQLAKDANDRLDKVAKELKDD